MEFTLKNVGIIEDSTLKLDGLTVVCGNNNSGKSTAGKALYCTIESLNNLSEKRNKELWSNYRRAAMRVCQMLDLIYFSRYVDFELIQNHFQKDFSVLLQDMYAFRYSVSGKDPVVAFNELCEVVDLVTPEMLYKYSKKTDSELPKKFFAYLDDLSGNCEKARKYLDGLRKFYQDDSWDDFIEHSVVSLFSSEFNGQIFPVNISSQERKSFISISKNEEIGVNISLSEKKRISASIDGFKSFFNDVVYIEDPYILDRIAEQDGFSSFQISENSTRYTHSGKLRRLLLQKNSESLIEQSINHETYDLLLNKISDIIPGAISMKESGFFYEEKGKEPLFVSNLATGSKMFSIIKDLIEKGIIAMDTMLILDEPEAHLHPEWQNIFAEVIVLLVKELDTTILLTTHSPNFLMAIEAYSQKHSISQNTHFYLSSHTNDGYRVNYHCVDGQLGQIYSSFAYPLVRMKQLKEDTER